MPHNGKRSPVPSITRCLSAALVLVFTVVLALPSTISAAVRLINNAYVMDGTAFPTPSPGFVGSAIKDFIAPTLGASYVGIPVTTPEHLVGIDQSVQDGLTALKSAIARKQTDPRKPFVIFGFSQSTVISMLLKAELEEQKAQGNAVSNVTFVGIGVGNRPNGGIAERLVGLTIPFFDFTFNGAAPTDPAHGFTTIDIARQYDGLADTPQFLINPFADLNAVLGVLFVHAFYGEQVSLDPNSPKYVPGTTKQQYGDTTYYYIPSTNLPLFDPLRLVGVPESLIDIVEPFFKVLVEAGYDRSIPFGEPTPAQLIPTIDPVTFALQLAGSVLEGANNAAKLVGAQLPGYATLTKMLTTAQTWSANTIGAPYRRVVSAINKVFNPILAFDRIEGPIAKAVDTVINRLGIPRALNAVLDATLVPITAWAERTLLFPQRDSAPGASDTKRKREPTAIAPPLDSPASMTDQTRHGA
ncbi:MAG TPA: PE-PPE domain-containing protein, partial [Mycobacterium sp.]